MPLRKRHRPDQVAATFSSRAARQPHKISRVWNCPVSNDAEPSLRSPSLTPPVTSASWLRGYARPPTAPSAYEFAIVQYLQSSKTGTNWPGSQASLHGLHHKPETRHERGRKLSFLKEEHHRRPRNEARNKVQVATCNSSVCLATTSLRTASKCTLPSRSTRDTTHIATATARHPSTCQKPPHLSKQTALVCEVNNEDAPLLSSDINHVTGLDATAEDDCSSVNDSGVVNDSGRKSGPCQNITSTNVTVPDISWTPTESSILDGQRRPESDYFNGIHHKTGPKHQPTHLSDHPLPSGSGRNSSSSRRPRQRPLHWPALSPLIPPPNFSPFSSATPSRPQHPFARYDSRPVPAPRRGQSDEELVSDSSAPPSSVFTFNQFTASGSRCQHPVNDTRPVNARSKDGHIWNSDYPSNHRDEAEQGKSAINKNSDGQSTDVSFYVPASDFEFDVCQRTRPEASETDTDTIATQSTDSLYIALRDDIRHNNNDQVERYIRRGHKHPHPHPHHHHHHHLRGRRLPAAHPSREDNPSCLGRGEGDVHEVTNKI